MASFTSFAKFALVLVVSVASVKQQHAEIQRDGSVQSFEAYWSSHTDEEKVGKLKPLLRSFVESLPRPHVSLPESAEKRFPNALYALTELDIAYQGHVHEPFFIKVDLDKAAQTVKAAGLPTKEAVYGEVQPMSFVQMLDNIDARPGMRYYDLGSGMGKTVIMAALLGFNATGVELVEQRWHASCASLFRARRRGLVRNVTSKADASFERASLLDIDLSDADVVFANSVLFTKEMTEGIAKHAERMKPGAKIISANGIPGAAFKDISSFSAPTTWSEKSRWKVQEVIKPDAGASLLEVSSGNKGKRAAGASSSRCSLSDPADAAAMLDKQSTSFRARLGVAIVSLLLLLNTYGDW